MRAKTLRDLGRYAEALAAFEETKRRFLANEVAPNAYAETLRDLGPRKPTPSRKMAKGSVRKRS